MTKYFETLPPLLLPGSAHRTPSATPPQCFFMKCKALQMLTRLQWMNQTGPQTPTPATVTQPPPHPHPVGHGPEVPLQRQRERNLFSDESVELADCNWEAQGFMNNRPANTLQPQAIQEHGCQGDANHIVIVGGIDALFSHHPNPLSATPHKLAP